MKKFEKILQYCNKIEESHTVRRSKEVDESQQFDVQKETSTCRQLDQILKVDSAYKKRQIKELHMPVELEQEALHQKTIHLEEIEEFDRQSLDFQLEGAHNAFEIVAEIQGFTFDERSHTPKQLPAGPPDAFTHELTDLTEMRLHREIEKNEAAIYGEQEEEPEDEPHKPETVFFFRPTTEKQ